MTNADFARKWLKLRKNGTKGDFCGKSIDFFADVCYNGSMGSCTLVFGLAKNLRKGEKKMLPSWGEFWGRVGECWSAIGEVIEVLRLPELLLRVLAVITSLAVCIVGIHILTSTRNNIRTGWSEDLPLPKGLAIALLYLGQIILILLYVLFNYGFWGTIESVQKSSAVAVGASLLWEYIFHTPDEADY